MLPAPAGKRPLWHHSWLNIILAALILLVYGLGLTVEIMEVDAAQYASISREMLETGQWLQVHHRYMDYLDKPPLLFWFSALSLKLFGVSIWAYKLPSVIFSFLGFYATYRLGLLLYDRSTGLLAALILATTQAWFMFNNDVRTDTLLASSVILAIWLLQEYRHSRQWKYLLAGFAAIALAMLSKGPIGLMVPVLALGTDMLLKKQWPMIFNWRWLVGIAFTLLLLLPMLFGLYQQFDLHPEKITNGVQGESGLKFFFWTQSFGRITGSNVWHNDDSPSLFFVHTFLWSFAPWSVLFIPAFIKKVVWVFKRNFRLSVQDEALTMAGFLLPFIVLSFSHYKLPHYIFVVYPLAALMLAQYLMQLKRKPLRIWSGVQAALLVIVWMAAGTLITYIFPAKNIWPYVVALLLLGITIAVWIRLKNLGKVVFATALTALAANFLMNASIYPNLLHYQAPSVASEYILDKQIPAKEVAYYRMGSHIMDFHLQRIIPSYFTPTEADSALKSRKSLWLFTDEAGYASLIQDGFRPQRVISFEHFPVALLNIKFILPKTREEALQHRYLLHLQAN